MMLTPSPKAKEINLMACSLYTSGFLFGTNITIYLAFLFYLNLYNSPTPVVPNLDFAPTYNVLHDTT